VRLIVSPERAPIDEAVAIRLTELAPGSRATIRARLATYFDGNAWASEAVFVADAAGEVDSARDAPVAGTYEGVDPNGLFWSMQRGDASDTPFNSSVPLLVTLTAEVDGAIEATATLERLVVPDGLVQMRVREHGLVGAFFRPNGDGPYPPVLVMGGSGGGIGGAYWQAALLARHGFATLALAYFAMDSLPPYLHEIPLEYFETAMAWLHGQPSVSGEGVGVMGTSRGGELVLLLGATFRQVRAVVAYVPSHVVWGGLAPNVPPPVTSWTRNGEPITILRRYRPGEVPPVIPEPRPGDPVALTPRFLRSLAGREDDEARAAIPVERINGPVMLISGQDDRMWPSSLMATRAAERLAAHRHPHRVEHLDYAGVGHSIYLPSLPTTVTVQVHPLDGTLYDLGGTPRANAHAAADSWPRVVRFLRESLRQ
jgi:dienelactone hydrolase